MALFAAIFFWVTTGGIVSGSGPPNGPSAESRMEQARGFSDRGHFSKAISEAMQAADLFGEKENVEAQAEALYLAASGYQALGRYKDARPILEKALTLAQTCNDRKMTALASGSMGVALFYTGDAEKAEASLKEGFQLALELKDPETSAVLSDLYARLHEMQKDYPEALRLYNQALEASEKGGNRPLAARISANAASAFLLSGDLERAMALLLSASEQYAILPNSHDKAYGLTLIGRAWVRLASALPNESQRSRSLACEAFTKAASTAQAIGDQRALSYALGYMAGEYEREGRHGDALQLTRRAIFAAQEIEATECLYLWEWQTGRLFKAMGRPKEAIKAYQSAISSLRSIRPQMMTAACQSCGQGDFRESGGAIFFELADLLLSYSDSLSDPKEKESCLLEARQTIEMLKTAELQDYFADPCVTALQTTSMRLEDIADDALVVYTITFPERLDLLLSGRSGIKRIKVAVDAQTLTAAVRALRLTLAKRTAWGYLPHAQKVYDWIVRPLEPELATRQIKTLIFVPDGPLRTIPMAALHDGRTFIIQRLAVVTTPGLDLTDPRALPRKDAAILLAGLSEASQGFSSLTSVKDEMDGIGHIYKGPRLENQDFVAQNLKNELRAKPYPLVHIATHGEFGHNAAQSFLLTWDDRIQMDQLDRLIQLGKYRKDPVELLTLSACQTAAGDDRAALGLAGVAIKAGARSALATLWNVSDQSSSLLIVEFYRQLLDPSVSKADALRTAQLKLLDSQAYRHPFYWSPFLLIGNWL